LVDYGEVEQALALPREESLSQLGSAELARLLGSSGFSRTGSGGSPFQAASPLIVQGSPQLPQACGRPA